MLHFYFVLNRLAKFVFLPIALALYQLLPAQSTEPCDLSISTLPTEVIETNTAGLEACIQVFLNKPACTQVSVEYKTLDGLARAGAHYTARQGTLIFNKGEISKLICIEILTDQAIQLFVRNFFIVLSSPQGAIVKNDTTEARLYDDDYICPKAIPFFDKQTPDAFPKGEILEVADKIYIPATRKDSLLRFYIYDGQNLDSIEAPKVKIGNKEIKLGNRIIDMFSFRDTPYLVAKTDDIVPKSIGLFRIVGNKIEQIPTGKIKGISNPVEFNDTLFFNSHFDDSVSNYYKFSGSEFTPVDTSLYEGNLGFFRLYKHNLYLISTFNGSSSLYAYNQGKLKEIDISTSGFNALMIRNTTIEYNGLLYFLGVPLNQTAPNNRYFLFAFDGEKITKIIDSTYLAKGDEFYVNSSSITTYNGKLYLSTVNNDTKSVKLISYDGSFFSTAFERTENSNFIRLKNFLTYKGRLFFLLELNDIVNNSIVYRGQFLYSYDGYIAKNISIENNSRNPLNLHLQGKFTIKGNQEFLFITASSPVTNDASVLYYLDDISSFNILPTETLTICDSISRPINLDEFLPATFRGRGVWYSNPGNPPNGNSFQGSPRANFDPVGINPGNYLFSYKFYDECPELSQFAINIKVENCDECPSEVKLTDWKASDLGEYPLSHAFYIYATPLNEGFPNGNDTDEQRFVWKSAGTFLNYGDSALITGTVYNKVDTSYKFDVYMKLIQPHTWEEWSAKGRTYMTDLKEAEDAAAEGHKNWTYWILSEESRLIGKEALAGDLLKLSHMPADLSKGFQMGFGGNAKDADFGLAGWFTYKGTMKSKYIEAAGDINSDLELHEENCDPILPTVVESLSATIGTDGEVGLSWNTLLNGHGTVIVERSLDSLLFQQISTHRFGQEPLGSESFLIKDPSAAKNSELYYRLKVLDEQGGLSYTPTIKVKSENGKSDYRIYPNPASGELYLEVRMPMAGVHQIAFYDAIGRRAYVHSIGNFNKIERIPLDALPAGMYSLAIEKPNGSRLNYRIQIQK